VAGIVTNGKMVGGAEYENVVITEEGQSSESVTNVYNSTGPPQDYESSDTSLKLGLPYAG
ncbi:MADS-box protein SVP-like, partial [Trifolium pratense]